MPSWYAAVMNLQDFVFNPFWAFSLAIYLTHRQDTAWFRTATISVSSMIIATSLVVYSAQAAEPGITGRKLLMLFLVNSPWALFPALFIVRMHRAGERLHGRRFPSRAETFVPLLSRRARATGLRCASSESCAPTRSSSIVASSASTATSAASTRGLGGRSGRRARTLPRAAGDPSRELSQGHRLRAAQG